MDRTVGLLGVILGVLAAGPAGADEPGPLARQAREVLAVHCYRCHGEKGAAEGGLNYLLDRTRLIAARKVVPGDPAASRLLQRVHAGEMPPAGEKTRPSKEELAVLDAWVKAGAPALRPVEKRQAITHEALLALVGKDLEGLAEEDRPFARYFTLTPLYNLGAGADELETYRQALSKLVNSLSWGPKVVVPEAIDPARTIFRIDLRRYLWTKKQWDIAAGIYRYRIFTGTETEAKIKEATGTPIFVLRADWFAARAADAGLYRRFLDLPITLQEVETKLRVDVLGDLRTGQALRAGFAISAVAAGPRVIQRHETPFGAYWLTCDGSRVQTLFDAVPLLTGKNLNRSGLEHLAMFHLPNGLLAYAVFDGQGQLEERCSPAVRDPRLPRKPAGLGLSCLSCHAGGIIAREDQVRARVDDRSKPFPAETLDQVRRLFPPKEKFQEIVKDDNQRYREALEKAGCRPATTDPIVVLALRHEEELDLARAAVELGQTSEELTARLEQVVKLPAGHGPPGLDQLLKGGTVKRWVFHDAFTLLARSEPVGAFTVLSPVVTPSPELLLPVPAPPPADSPAAEVLTPLIPTPRDAVPAEPLKVTEETDHLLCEFPRQIALAQVVAVAPGDRLAACESRPGIVTLFDPVTAEQRLHLEGHKDAILDLCFSPDGRRLATASRDKTVRLWDVATGKTLKTFALSAAVLAVRFSGDGDRLATLTDRVQLWDANSGERSPIPFPQVPEALAKLALSPDGQLIVTTGRSVRVWDASSGKEKVVLREQRGGAAAAVFSPDGKTLATGGNDGTILLWDAAALEKKATLKEHRDAVNALAFTPDGKLLISGSGGGFRQGGELKVWALGEGGGEPKLHMTLETGARGDASGVVALGVGAGGKLLAAAGADRRVRVWSLDRTAPLTAPKAALGPFRGHEGDILCLHLARDGKTVVTGGADKTVRVWDAATGEELLNLLGHEKAVTDVILSPDGMTVSSAGRDHTFRRWDLKKGIETSKVDLDPQTMATVFSRDGAVLAVGMTRGSVRLLDTATGKERGTLDGLELAVDTLAFSPDGKLLAAADQGGHVRLWELASGKGRALATPSNALRVSQLTFSSDAKMLASGSVDRTVHLWDAETGKELRHIGTFPTSVRGVLFAPDGRSLFVSCGASSRPPQSQELVPSGCAIVRVEVPSGKVLAFWDELPGIPYHSVWAGDSLLTVLGSGLKKWVPASGKPAPRP